MKRTDENRGTRKARRWTLRAAAIVVVVLAASALRAESPNLDERLVNAAPPGFVETLWSAAGATTFEIPSLPVRTTALRREPVVIRNRFYREHLIPRLSRQLEPVTPVVPAAGTTAEMGRHAMFEEYRELTAHLTEKGARRAVKNYLLEVTSIDAWIAGTKQRHGRIGAGGESLRLRLRVSHAVPRAELEYRTGSTALNLGLSTERALSLEFRHLHRSDTRVVAVYHGETGEYALTCRMIF